MARPSLYTDELAAEICARIMDGKSLRQICHAEDMPHRATVFRWLANHESFHTDYGIAKNIAADDAFDEILEIADDASRDWKAGENGTPIFDAEHVQRARLRIDARKWVLCKLAPKKYGDKLDLEHRGEVGLNIKIVRFSDLPLPEDESP